MLRELPSISLSYPHIPLILQALRAAGCFWDDLSRVVILTLFFSHFPHTPHPSDLCAKPEFVIARRRSRRGNPEFPAASLDCRGALILSPSKGAPRNDGPALRAKVSRMRSEWKKEGRYGNAAPPYRQPRIRPIASRILSIELA